MNVHKNARLAPKGREILIFAVGPGQRPDSVRRSHSRALG